MEEKENIKIVEDIQYVVVNRKPLSKIIFLMIFYAIITITSTYAWFTVQKVAKITGIEGAVSAPSGLQISLDAKNWTETINLKNVDAHLDSEMTLKTPYIGGSNIIPEKMTPVSTTGKDGIGQTDIKMYRAMTADGRKISSVLETNPNSISDKEDPGYIAIDLFMKNTIDTGDGLENILQLNSNSFAKLKAGGDETKGLQNTIRVALARYDLTAPGTATQEQIIAATTGENAKIADVAIWEPNASDHVDVIVDRNNNINWSDSDKKGYNINQTTGEFTETTKIPTYALTSIAETEITGGTVISNVYDWSGTNSKYLEKQITLQTDKKTDYYIKGGVRNLISVNTPESAIYAVNPTGEKITFGMPSNGISRFRLYVWLEGQDVDCINHAAYGGGISIDLGLSTGILEGNGAEIIKELQLDKTEEQLKIGEETTITATTNYSDEDEIIWSSSDLEIVSIEPIETETIETYSSEGTSKTWSVKVKAVNGGVAKITAQNSIGTESKSCKIVVAESYLPEGFTPVKGTNLSNGFTIQDPSGNEYVWIEVPKTLYDNNNGANKPASETDYDNIEYCLKQYTNTYRNGTYYDDINHEGTGLTSERYTELKNAMLSSIYKNGGFYIGKYETGMVEDTVRTSNTAISQTPVIQKDKIVYNWITNSQAQTLAASFDGGGYNTSLMFGVQWDLVLKHIETKNAATVAQLSSGSTEIGNYTDSRYTISREGVRWSSDYGKTYTTITSTTPLAKTPNQTILLSTGAHFNQMGIYDIAGNVFELVLERTSNSSYPCAGRGGSYNEAGSSSPANYRYVGQYGWNANSCSNYIGFRVTLY